MLSLVVSIHLALRISFDRTLTVSDDSPRCGGGGAHCVCLDSSESAAARGQDGSSNAIANSKER